MLLVRWRFKLRRSPSLGFSKRLVGPKGFCLELSFFITMFTQQQQSGSALG